MIRSAALRLTLWYLLIITIICLGFSVLLYRISSLELQNELRRPPRFIYGNLDPDVLENIDVWRTERLAEGQARLRSNLFLLNLSALGLGTAASYALAKRTLQPIQRALEAQSRFTADASHELRTPLTVMQTEIEVALRDKKLSQNDMRELLTSNLEEVGKLKRLSEGLLRLAQQDKQAVPMEPVNLAEIADEALESLSTLAKQRRITLSKHLKQDVTVLGDAANLQELVTILADNAIKYSPDKTTITVRLRTSGRQAILSVQDQGIGIANKDLGAIFDRFYRADPSRTRAQSTPQPSGYGLGLSIANKILQLHNGHIEVKSTPGKGSTFTVKLALAHIKAA